MPKFHNVNVNPANDSEAVMSLKATLLAAGWTEIGGGTGATYAATGAVVTSAVLLAVTRAWFRLRDPGGRREIIFQWISATNYRIKISEEARFTGGSPNATTVPSATDEHVVFGGGTDASPTGAQLFNTAGTYRCHTVAMDTAAGTSNCYPFWFWTTVPGTGLTSTVWFWDGLEAVYPADTAPAAMFIAYFGNSQPTIATKPGTPAWNIAGNFYARNQHNTVNAQNVRLRMALLESGTGVFGGQVASGGSMAGYYDPVPSAWYPTQQEVHKLCILFGIYAVGSGEVGGTRATGIKGVLSSTVLNCNSRRVWPDTVGLTVDAYAFIGGTANSAGAQWAFPWPENVAPVA